MKQLNGVVLLGLATLLVSQTSAAFGKNQEVKKLQVDVLVLDAVMNLAFLGSAGGIYAAWEEVPRGSAEAEAFHHKIDAAASAAALGYCPTCESLDWVSKKHTSWWKKIVWGPFVSGTDGYRIARNTAVSLAQTSQADTWGPDFLWDITKEDAREAIHRKASVEEIGMAAAKSSWDYVLNISGEIRDAVRREIETKYLADTFDAQKVLTSLKKTIDTDKFKRGLPQAQDFYKASVAHLEQKMKALKLIP